MGNEVFKVNVGDKVKYVREIRGHSLTELSEISGVSLSYLSEIENSKKNPSNRALTKIAQALNANTWFFMDDNALNFEEMVKVSDYEPPEDIVEFFAKRESLPYAVLAKELGEENIDPEFLRDLLQSIKKMKSK